MPVHGGQEGVRYHPETRADPREDGAMTTPVTGPEEEG
jgi:hypothetical protein